MQKNNQTIPVVSISQKVINIVAETLHLDPKQITLEMGLQKDLFADSIDIPEIFIALEQEFPIKLDDMNKHKGDIHIKDLVNYVEYALKVRKRMKLAQQQKLH